MQTSTRTRVADLSPDGALASASRRNTFERNRHRIYAIAFWMTGNELAAEALMADVFRTAFRSSVAPSTEEVDRALLVELRQIFDIPVLALQCAPCTEVRKVRRAVLRTDLEAAVLQLPATEKLLFLMHDLDGYSHDHVARLLGITERESRLGLHQARLRLRELLPQ